MAFPKQAEYINAVVGTRGFSTARRLAERLARTKKPVENQMLGLETSGIAFGVFRKSGFQLAVRELITRLETHSLLDHFRFDHFSNSELRPVPIRPHPRS